jgi:hypothetical protein
MLKNNELFKYTTRISFELSNLCNYSRIHKACPLNLEKEPKILPSRVVYETLDILSKYEYNKIIAFHVYSEPLTDPRLFKFIEYARKVCPNSDIYFSTNGAFLDQILLDELVDIGLSNIHISAYFNSEFNRLSKLNFTITHKVERLRLIMDHLEIYDKPIIDSIDPCYAPLNDIVVTRDGILSLCCRDWKRIHNFGNLNKIGLDEVLREGKLHEAYKKLSNGNRYLDLCRRCGSVR